MLTKQNLSLIEEGMQVHDKDGALIGIVRTFRQGEGAMGVTSTDVDTMIQAVSDVLELNKKLPAILAVRLYQEGFVCVKRGLLRKDVIVFPDQIEDISGDYIFLNVDQDDLPTL